MTSQRGARYLAHEQHGEIEVVDVPVIADEPEPFHATLCEIAAAHDGVPAQPWYEALVAFLFDTSNQTTARC